MPSTENIGHRVLTYVEKYAFSSNVRTDDDIIAAAAVENNILLVVSSNVKYFKVVEVSYSSGFSGHDTQITGTDVMTYSVKLICFALIISMPGISTAGFRCTNGKLLIKGDTKSEVKVKCGQPVDTEFVGVVRINREYVNLDRWTYNPGKGKLLKILDFHDGVLTEINNGPRM